MPSLIAPTKEGSEDLFGMAYISRITSGGLISAGTLNDISKTSIHNNLLNQITGILCYGNGYFFQYVEGNEQALTNLKNELLVDSRHQEMHILYYDRILQRSFEKWALQSWVLQKGMVKEVDLKNLLPFRPDNWQGDDWKDFLALLKEYAVDHEHEFARPLRYNTLGLTLTRLVSMHQAFLFIQAMLILMLMVNWWLLNSTSF